MLIGIQNNLFAIKEKELKSLCRCISSIICLYQDIVYMLTRNRNFVMNRLGF